MPGGIFLIVFLYPLETGIEEPEKNGGTLSPAFVAIALPAPLAYDVFPAANVVELILVQPLSRRREEV